MRQDCRERKADELHEIGVYYELERHDGFDLTVHLEADTACSPYDYEASFSKSDLASWNLTWRFVGVMVEASQDGHQLGHAAYWLQTHGVMGDGAFRDALGRSGVFSGQDRDHIIAEAVMDAVDTLRLREIKNLSDGDDPSEYFSTPTVEKLTKPIDQRYQWMVTWPDGQFTTYRNRTAAWNAVLGTVLHLWTK